MITLKNIIDKFINVKLQATICLLLYLVYAVIPVYYSLKYKLRHDTKLNKSYGTINVIKTKGYKTGGKIIRITNNNEKTDFSFKDKNYYRDIIPLPENKIKYINGKSGTIYWFKRPLFGKSVNYVVQLEVNNETIISREKIENKIKRECKSSIIYLIITGFVYVIFILIINKKEEKRKLSEQL